MTQREQAIARDLSEAIAFLLGAEGGWHIYDKYPQNFNIAMENIGLALAKLGYRLVPDLKVLSEEIYKVVDKAVNDDALLFHRVATRGHWEDIVLIVAQATVDSINKQIEDANGLRD